MKKLIFGIAGIIAMVSSADAVDTAQIKAACQSSDKTLWVERNQVCIPRNPCKDSKFEKYCNKDFADFQSPAGSDMYISLINLYANSHNLSCSAVRQEAKWVGQDYVVCMGTDVMVFEFEDIEDKNIFHLMPEAQKSQLVEVVKAICKATGGFFREDNSVPSCHLSVSNCPKDMNNALTKYMSVLPMQNLRFVEDGEKCVVAGDSKELNEWRDATNEVRDSTVFRDAANSIY